MSEAKLIYGQISKIMSEVKSIGKDRVNEQQRFKFRGIDDVYNHVQPLFAKHGVFPAIQQKGEMKREEGSTKSGGIMYRMRAVYDVHFYAQDGSFVTVTLEAEGMDSADKGTNKCHSVAHKYALLTLLMIPTEDIAEPDAVTPESATFKKQEPEPEYVTFDELTALNEYGETMYAGAWTDKRKELVKHVTKGRTEHAKELYADECAYIISGIKKKLEGNK